MSKFEVNRLIQKNSNLNVSMLWFGAAVSIAEILTGTMLAPLGLARGFAAIIAGHFIGGFVLYLAGIIGANEKCSSSESVQMSFGTLGSVTFSVLNVIQLIGWITIMIIIGSQAMNNLSAQLWQMPPNTILWSIILGMAPCIWVITSNFSAGMINRVVMLCLLAASLWLGFTTVFGTDAAAAQPEGGMTFGTAVELNIAMCLSWMPVISDYTRTLRRPFSGTLSCVACYCFGGILMYSIGLGAAVHYGTSDICGIFMLSGLGVVSLIIILLSTVTTNYIAVNSSSICLNYIFSTDALKIGAVAVCIISTVLSVFLSMEQYEEFLYFIAAIFAPLFAISFSEYFFTNNIHFIMKNTKLVRKNRLLWLVGFIVYEALIQTGISTPVGITVPLMMALAFVNVVLNRFINTSRYNF